MQEINIWLTAISTVGFPIVGFLLMFWFMTKVIRENTKAFRDLHFVILKFIDKQE